MVKLHVQTYNILEKGVLKHLNIARATTLTDNITKLIRHAQSVRTMGRVAAT